MNIEDENPQKYTLDYYVHYSENELDEQFSIPDNAEIDSDDRQFAVRSFLDINPKDDEKSFISAYKKYPNDVEEIIYYFINIRSDLLYQYKKAENCEDDNNSFAGSAEDKIEELRLELDEMRKQHEEIWNAIPEVAHISAYVDIEDAQNYSHSFDYEEDEEEFSDGVEESISDLKVLHKDFTNTSTLIDELSEKLDAFRENEEAAVDYKDKLGNYMLY